MGLNGISKSQVSELCKYIDERVNALLDRPIDDESVVRRALPQGPMAAALSRSPQ
jgi:hypothetical protein